MQRVLQDLDSVLNQLSVLDTIWRDDFAQAVLDLVDSLPTNRVIDAGDIETMLRTEFEPGMTIVRLFLDRSKDEFNYELKVLFEDGLSTGKSGFSQDPRRFVHSLLQTGLLAVMNKTIARPITWVDLLAERLKAGRGSAIKGQYRGRVLEDFVEQIVASVFGPDSYDARTSFIGKDGRSTAKSDFAIPSKDSPQILIEVKAFGATGSKQTNVIGDAQSIIDQKRHDTVFIVVTDGITWHARKSDLRHLIELQNAGDVYKIYTMKMASDLESDLQQMRGEFGL